MVDMCVQFRISIIIIYLELILNIKYYVKFYNFNVFYYFFKILAIYASEIVLILIHVYCKYYKKNWYVFKQIMDAIMKSIKNHSIYNFRI
jgi:hypothetical protein